MKQHLIMIILLAFGLAACGLDSDSNTTGSSSAQSKGASKQEDAGP